ncbi:tRNA pseudouridine synthase A [Bifidobacterium sp. ESL0764]|uniref:tRNA pseudouridine synthase A n=1 Tax=Bifidobacterium sp. ESL0764 TaxID=2983228 RepID=UPI0023F8EBA9|nr:tRNA pseudouridine synthase A [Bifidobacterium sp. ESL0764]WEV65448.1 tRNA pseudouridine synthase A [Bifidobacterium sp. ESL0764]
MRLRIDLAYDGGGFHGWAKQPGLRTVQGELEEALGKILHVSGRSGRTVQPSDAASGGAKHDCRLEARPGADESLQLVVAGRTDTGVHAAQQVCHLDVSEETLQRCVGHMDVPATVALERRLRHALPADIALHHVSVAPDGFDARFSALQRTYVYRISDGLRSADPRLRGFVWNIEDTLDIQAMNRAAAMTIGLHDFGSFATPNPGGTTIREVKQAVWRRVPVTGMYGDALDSYHDSAELDTAAIGDAALGSTSKPEDSAAADATGAMDGQESDHHSTVRLAELTSPVAFQATAEANQNYIVPSLESGLVCFTIVADAFAHNMVRSLVNACVQVGRHRKSLEWFAHKMAKPEREGSTGPIAACGLTLEHVAYPPDSELAGRARSIRARRTLD